jgi:murein DD-endopeptidase MepM/ murein hydrolase activator NlpD
LTGKIGSSKRRFYIVFVSREQDGNLRKVPVPMTYAYVFVAAAVIGMFTITGMAGSYTRMLIKTARFNQLRQDHDSLRKDYAHLEKQAREKDVQAASLGSLATEVSALYGLTTSKLAIPMGKLHLTKPGKTVANISTASVVDTANLTDDDYYKSVDTFYSLRSEAMSGSTSRAISTSLSTGSGFGAIRGFDSSLTIASDTSNIPSLWPVVGPISSSFGQREDPILGNGEGEFHKGVDITAPLGTPVRATANGVVKSAGLVNGYGREVVIDHGHGIGYVGHSGRSTGNHVHYEVRVQNNAVNPHKYLRSTLADLGTESPKAGS